jgi:hypothetical protein
MIRANRGAILSEENVLLRPRLKPTFYTIIKGFYKLFLRFF